ncbi:MAG: aminomethyl-transferring glycine dehydrogenase subunit GcvPA [Gammaproteobacteria bacterium]|nr:aminomethyl-transferring glycine dehydrogenase subunit GcvPA [Gammaproteobacteria bacterium]
MPYIPHTDNEIKEMLDTIGVGNIEELFDEIPASIKAGELQKVPSGVCEMVALREMADRAEKDSGALCFIGAGAYEHHIPAAVWDIAARGEFMTAYTPYQAEASQGTLQVIYEYQSMMAHLTGMDVSNASMYDGASGLAEAVLMSIRANKKAKSRRVLMPSNVHPLYRETCTSIVSSQHIELVDVPFDEETGKTSLKALSAYEGEKFAALVIAQPNFFGVLDDVDALTNWAHSQGMLVIAVCNPTSLALLTPPGEWGEKGADIAVGEGQPLGIPLSSGGPYFGYMCCKQAIVRQMPGRIIGRTVDQQGKEGFVLTLQAREQHIRRSKATSNICTNQGWAVTAATLYMSLMGAQGLGRVARASHQNLQKLKQSVGSIEGVALRFSNACFHEVVIELNQPAQRVLDKMAESGILGGYALAKDYGWENAFLVCVTETKTDADIIKFAQALRVALTGGSANVIAEKRG